MMRKLALFTNPYVKSATTFSMVKAGIELHTSRESISALYPGPEDIGSTPELLMSVVGVCFFTFPLTYEGYINGINTVIKAVAEYDDKRSWQH
jgi:hypothetical protein